MKKKSISLKRIVFICIGLIVISCSDNSDNSDNSDKVTKNDDINEQQFVGEDIILEKLGHSSYQDMLDSGWEVIPHQKPVLLQGEPNTEKVKEKITIAQIRQLGYQDEDLIKLYTQFYNKEPDGVAINDYGTKGAHRPLITNLFSWYAYIETGTPTTTVVKTADRPSYSDTIYWLTNNSPDLTDKGTETYTYQESTTSTWNVTGTLGVKVGAKVGIPLVTEGSIETSLSISIGRSNSETIVNTVAIAYTMDIPPHSKRAVVIRRQLYTTEMNYEFPVYITGLVGLNYPSVLNGHFYYSAPANLLVKGKDNKETGVIHVKTMTIEVLGGPAIPL